MQRNNGMPFRVRARARTKTNNKTKYPENGRIVPSQSNMVVVGITAAGGWCPTQKCVKQQTEQKQERTQGKELTIRENANQECLVGVVWGGGCVE